MRRTDRRAFRRRTYSLVAFLLAIVVAIVALGGFLQLGTNKIDQSVYSSPHRTLLALAKAETRFRRNDLDRDGKHDYAASLAELSEAGCITRRLSSGVVGDYRYEVLQADEETYSLRASPVEVTSSSLFFFIDQSNVVRARIAAPADASSDVYYHPLRGLEWSGGGR